MVHTFLYNKIWQVQKHPNNKIHALYKNVAWLVCYIVTIFTNYSSLDSWMISWWNHFLNLYFLDLHKFLMLHFLNLYGFLSFRKLPLKSLFFSLDFLLFFSAMSFNIPSRFKVKLSLLFSLFYRSFSAFLSGGLSKSTKEALETSSATRCIDCKVEEKDVAVDILIVWGLWGFAINANHFGWCLKIIPTMIKSECGILDL